MLVLVLVMAVVFSLLCLTMVAQSTLDFVVDLEFLAVFEVFFDFLRLLRLLFFAILVGLVLLLNCPRLEIPHHC